MDDKNIKDNTAESKQSQDKKQENIEKTPEVEETKETTELEKCQTQVEEYKTRYLRALADYQNFERRVRNEKETVINTAKAQVILSFLPFLDNLEKAEVFIKDPGLKMIKDHFYQTLRELHIKEIDIVGKEFDPHMAEAVDIVPGEKDDTVVEITRKGFMLGDRVLRVAQVKVSKKQ